MHSWQDPVAQLGGAYGHDLTYKKGIYTPYAKINDLVTNQFN